MKKEKIRWLKVGVVYPVSYIKGVCPVQCVPKNRSITMVANDRNELITLWPVTGWLVCMDCRNINIMDS